MKKTKIIVPALAMLLLGTAASVSGTVAWFSSSSIATVNGMTIKTKVSSNLMVSATNVEANYGPQLTQTVNKILEPASSCDGVAFFYTLGSNVTATGDARTDAYIDYSSQPDNPDSTNYNDHFSYNYGVNKTDAPTLVTGETGAVAYVDYAFYVKATNVEGSAQQVKMTKCNLLYNGAAISNADDLAWRVAVFAKSTTQGATVSDEVAAGNLKTIIQRDKTREGNGYFTSGKAIKSTSTLDSVTNPNVAANLGEIANGATGYLKITVRLWLEGEDVKCNNDTYAALTNAYSLDLELKLDKNASAIDTISSAVSA